MKPLMKQSELFPELMSSSEASHDHANHFPSRASSAAMPTSDTCGPKPCGSCANCDPTGHALRTSLASELSGLTGSSKTWSRRATPSGRSWWVLTTVAPRIGENGCSSWGTPMSHERAHSPRAVDHGVQLANQVMWPTPQTVDSKATPQPLRRKADRQTRGETPGSYRGDLADHVAMWPTATAGDANSSGSRNLEGSNAHPGTSLTDATCRWPTPRAEDSESAGAHRTRGTAETLTASVRWNTPRSRDWKGSGKDCLDRQVWTTPTCRDQESPAKLTRGKGSTAAGNQIVEPLGLQVQAPSNTAGSLRVASLVLNPGWVTYLMGFPGDWLRLPADTLSALWETRSCRKSQKSSRAPSVTL